MHRVQFEWQPANGPVLFMSRDFETKELAEGFANAFLPALGLRAARPELGEVASDGRARIRLFGLEPGLGGPQ